MHEIALMNRFRSAFLTFFPFKGTSARNAFMYQLYQLCFLLSKSPLVTNLLFCYCAEVLNHFILVKLSDLRQTEEIKCFTDRLESQDFCTELYSRISPGINKRVDEGTSRQNRSEWPCWVFCVLEGHVLLFVAPVVLSVSLCC